MRGERFDLVHKIKLMRVAARQRLRVSRRMLFTPAERPLGHSRLPTKLNRPQKQTISAPQVGLFSGDATQMNRACESSAGGEAPRGRAPPELRAVGQARADQRQRYVRAHQFKHGIGQA
jgi:hypothetical protein